MDNKYQFFQSVLNADLEYQELQKAHYKAGLQFHRVIDQLEQKDKEILFEYLGSLAELQMRELELALTLK